MSQSLLLGGGGVGLWVSGTTYAQGKQVVSPVDSSIYIRRVAGAGTTDPSSDAANWKLAYPSRWITNPKQLPITVVNQATLYLKKGAGLSVTCTAANAATFFTEMALKGAQASVSVADTYVTLASLTGSGLLFNVVCATNTGAVYTPTLRITVDGVVYIITSSGTINATYRLILGALIPMLPSLSAAATIGTDIISPNAGADPGFQSASVGGLITQLGNVGLVSPENIMAYNMPMLRFESSLLVEMKTSLLASSAGDRIGGVSYRLEV